MLSARRFPSICLSCRLASQARSAHRHANGRFYIPSRDPRPSPSIAAAQSTSQRRAFSTKLSKGEDQAKSRSEATSPNADNGTQQPTNQLSVEDSVRRARQLFGDTLPRGHLSDKEYAVYERLYGTPVFVEKGKDLTEGEVEEAMVEEELPDGTHILLRKDEDGNFVEVEYEKDVDAEAEEDVESRNSMKEEEWEALKDQRTQEYHDEVYARTRPREDEWEEDEEEQDEDFMRAHPLTIAGRFAPSPSTVFLPKETFVDPVSVLLTRANHKHLAETSNQIFGGRGLPHSAKTAAAHEQKEQKPIPLDPSLGELSNIESDAYMAAVMPGTYATVMSTLVEVRRRLGSTWIERLLQRKGGPVVLDAGAGGAGIIAWHEVLKAEWTRMHEESGAVSQDSVPLGKATVLAASDTLRFRASRLLENTTFIPRLPDDVTAADEANVQQPRKLYDLIIAPHTLWPLKQEYLRKEQVEKYWSLLNPKGGVLILLEKGLPRGFEVIAAARELLLEKHIASPNSAEIETPVEQQTSKPDEETRYAKKELGMIIAPCTNHSTCPMYKSAGISQGRKDFCFFNQRYIRPPYLQKILNAKDKNHEDIQFSYLAVQRGRDQRLPLHDILGKGIVQNEETTSQAFEGHEYNAESEMPTSSDINTLTLPRLILPPLKRRGHIVLDVCTPAGTLERWTVPRSFSKQAFRDARKARWGDLWALGAKTRTSKNVRLGKPRDEFDKKGRRIKAPRKQVYDVEYDETGLRDVKPRNDGRYGLDRKIRGSGGRKGRKQNQQQRASLVDDG